MAPAALPPLHVIPRRESLAYTERFSEAYLDALRRKGDPLSDRVVAELAANDSLRNYHDLLGEVRRRAAAGSTTCRELLEVTSTVPPWADFAAMETGQRIIAAFPLHMGISLFSGSLCGGAVFQKMAIITAMTGMFGGDPSRRLNETGAMVLGLAFPGSIAPGGEGHELLVRVRLLHSAIRRFLVDTGRFRHDAEVPINQQDLAITLGLFGYLNVRSLGKMGIHLTADELASYNLLWRYVGYVLGIEEALLPSSIVEQQEFFLASLRHQGRPEKLSPKTKDVLDSVARNATKTMPGLFPAVQRFLHQSCRWLSGDEYVTGMQLEDAGEDYWGFAFLKGLGRAQSFAWHHVPGAAEALYALGAGGYRAWLAHARRHRDVGGEYRVRTVDAAAARPHAA